VWVSQDSDTTTENVDLGWDGGISGTEWEDSKGDNNAVLDASDGAGPPEEDMDTERDAGNERRRRQQHLVPLSSGKTSRDNLGPGVILE